MSVFSLCRLKSPNFKAIMWTGQDKEYEAIKAAFPLFNLSRHIESGWYRGCYRQVQVIHGLTCEDLGSESIRINMDDFVIRIDQYRSIVIESADFQEFCEVISTPDNC